MRAGLTVAALLTTACVTTEVRSSPGPGALLALSPGSLGRELHLAQRVTVHRGDQTWAFDAQLEADAHVVQLAAFLLGQTVAKLSWDGATMEQSHSERAPDVVTPERILSDVQLAFWPAAAVREGLPSGYSLLDDGARRTVLHDGRPFVSVNVGDLARVELEHHAYGYRLTIESKEAP